MTRETNLYLYFLLGDTCSHVPQIPQIRKARSDLRQLHSFSELVSTSVNGTFHPRTFSSFASLLESTTTMAPSPSDPKYRITYLSGGNPASRRDSLTNGGPLTILGAHFLVTALPKFTTLRASGEYTVQQHTIEFVFGSVLSWEDDLLDHHLVYRVSRFDPV